MFSWISKEMYNKVCETYHDLKYEYSKLINSTNNYRQEVKALKIRLKFFNQRLQKLEQKQRNTSNV